MHIFIDESGTHQKDGHSALALVYVLTSDAVQLENAILETEKELRISSFHWPKHIWKIRFAFVEKLLIENFTVKTAVIENPFNKDRFERAIFDLLTERKVKKMVIDGHRPKWYILRFKKTLRSRGISAKKIVNGDDASFPCLRLADAYAGLIRAYWNAPSNDNAQNLYQLASKKITTQLVGGQVSQVAC